MPRRVTLTGIGVALLLAGCGDQPRIPQVASQTPMLATTVGFSQTGTGGASIDPTSVSYGQDDSGLLVIRLSIRSTAGRLVTVAVRASLYDPQDHIIGDAGGGVVNVAPGASVGLKLNGPQPSGTIARTRFEVTVT